MLQFFGITMSVYPENHTTKTNRAGYSWCQERIDNLLKVYISSGNSEKELLSDEEFKTQKTSLLKEKTEIEQKLDHLSRRADEWLELTEKTFKFAIYAKHHFDQGDYKTKTSILRSLGSSFVLKDGQIDIELRKQYQIIEKGIETTKAQNPRLELTSFALDKTKTASFEVVSATWSG